MQASGIPGWEEGMIFISVKVLQYLLGLGYKFHCIAVVNSNEMTEEISD